ncbi:type I restriction endonuclease [Desulfobulbus alkaliphilus]|uniref:type I restriction endonuclease n=1 Tax=Desulfobulbus alkaliphilus TaxID=869814 RepID=UPI001F0655BF|nr:type I restriction endonuclease [Desulfobulbus alkaliphilus]
MNKKQLSERDICTKYITPALEKAGWDVTTQVREEFPLTKGRIIVRGKLHTRAKHKRADYVLFYKPNILIAIIEAKDNNHTVGDGMQQALGYADMLQVPFVFSSNGDAQRISQMVWLIFLKIFDDKEQEWQLTVPGYKSPLPSRFRWSSWAKNPHEVKVNHRDPEELMVEYQQIVHQLEAAQAALKAELMACLGGKA